MQQPLDNMSEDARRDDENSRRTQRDQEARRDRERGRIERGDTANALRDLEAGTRAAESFGGWSIVT